MDDDGDGEAGGSKSASEPENDSSEDEEELNTVEEAEQDRAAELDEEARRRVRHVQAVDFAIDGSLCAAGCRERHMVVLDPSRPERGPLGLFMAMGEVTTVSMGQGVRPWRETESMYQEEAQLMNRLWDTVGDDILAQEPEEEGGSYGGMADSSMLTTDSLTGDDLDVHGGDFIDLVPSGSRRGASSSMKSPKGSAGGGRTSSFRNKPRKTPDLASGGPSTPKGRHTPNAVIPDSLR